MGIWIFESGSENFGVGKIIEKKARAAFAQDSSRINFPPHSMRINGECLKAVSYRVAAASVLVG